MIKVVFICSFFFMSCTNMTNNLQRQPSSDFACGVEALGSPSPTNDNLTFFNSRRMLTLNQKINNKLRYLTELERVYPEDENLQNRIQTLGEAKKSIEYPNTKAYDSPTEISLKLRKAAKLLLDDTRYDPDFLVKGTGASPPSMAFLKDDYNYLVNNFLPNLEKVELWSPQACQ